MPTFAVRMIEVAHYIEQLLLHHDCVIVPGLGGFVAQDCGASYVEEEAIFLPPYRSVSFNPCLTMNDGLLASEIAQRNGLSYAEAQQTIKQEVAIIHQTIRQKGKYNLSGIGQLHATSEASTYEFTPLPCGIAAPSLYGLDSFYIAPLQKIETPTPAIEMVQPDKDTLTFKVRLNVIRYAAAVAVAAVFFFVCLAPLSTAMLSERSEANMLHDLWAWVLHKQAQTPIETPQAIEPAVKPQPVQAKQQANAVTDTNAPTAEAPSAETSPQDPPADTKSLQADKAPKDQLESGEFTIVVLSAIPEAGALQQVSKMQQAGFAQTLMYKTPKMIRVVYGRYATKEDAQQALRNIRTADNEFAKAWVLQIP